MSTRDFKTFSGSDEVNRLQDNIVDALGPIIKSPLTDAVLITKVDLSTTPKKVAHKLGRNLQGWIVASKDAAEDIIETERSKTSVTLQATGAVTISVLVF